MERDDFAPPARQSLSDDELDQLVQQSHSDPAGTLAAMEALAQQAQLRQQDDLAFAQWVTKLESIGTPEALKAIDSAKRALGWQPQEQEAVQTPEATVEVAADAVPAPSQPSEADLAEEFRPVSTLSVAAVEVGEPLEHDMAAVTNTSDAEEILDVELDLHTGVAVSDFDAILHSESEAENDAFEPAEIETSSIPVIAQQKHHHRSPASLFWVWFSLTAGVVPVALGFALKAMGVTGLQAFVALAVGVVSSAIVVGVGAVAGKRSGMFTSVIARSTFGVYGNLIPGLANVIAKVVITALVALCILQSLGGRLLGLHIDAQVLSSIPQEWLSYSTLTLIAVIILAAVLAALKVKASLMIQISIGALGLFAIGLVVTKTPASVSTLFVNTNSSWWATLGAALLIFAGFGGLWANSAADFTSGIAASASGFRTFSFTALGLLVPLVSGSFGILLAQSESQAKVWFGAIGFAGWQLSVAEGLLVISLIGWAILSVSSLGNSLAGLGLRLSRAWLLALAAALVSATAIVADFGNAWNLLFEMLPVLGVPLLAWTGLFTTEVLIRRMAYHEVSLQHGYGIYRSINWLSISGFIVAVTIGLGYVQSSYPWFTWAGYLIKYSGGSTFWHESQLGLGIAFLIGALTPVAFGISRIKRQEAEMQAIENRRLDLNDVDLSLD